MTCLFQQIDSDWEEIEMTQAERDIRRKLRIFKYAEESGNVAKTCRYFGISRRKNWDFIENLTHSNQKFNYNKFYASGS